MDEQRRKLKRVVLRRIDPSRLFGQHCHKVVQHLCRALQEAGFDLRKRPSLEEMKWLLVDVFRLVRPVLPPLVLSARWAPDPPAEDESSRSRIVGRPMEILMVEDSLTFARVTMGALRRGGIEHRLTWLTDGAEAMEFLRRQGKFAQAPRPDLILLDLGLPGKDGRGILFEIKSDEHLRDIPVVVMTISTDEQDRIMSELLQVEAYLVKPVNIEKFLLLVRALKRYWHEDMILPAGV